MVKPGQVALAAPILAVTPALRTALHNDGYAFAAVSEPLAVAEPAAHLLDVSYKVTPGPRVKIGPIRFSGLTRTNEEFLRRHIELREGQRYSDTAITAARDSLLNLGVFSSVTAAAAGPADTGWPGADPVPRHATEAARRQHSAAATPPMWA